jgi:hypothetical protein
MTELRAAVEGQRVLEWQFLVQKSIRVHIDVIEDGRPDPLRYAPRNDLSEENPVAALSPPLRIIVVPDLENPLNSRFPDSIPMERRIEISVELPRLRPQHSGDETSQILLDVVVFENVERAGIPNGAEDTPGCDLWIRNVVFIGRMHL